MSGMPTTSGNVLCWPKNVLSADDLRRHLTSQRELLLLPKTVVTPLAADELKAKGVRIAWQSAKVQEQNSSWCWSAEKPDATVRSAVQALERDGVILTWVEGAARTMAQTVVRDELRGILFAVDGSVTCCLTNKVAGVRALVASNAMQVKRVKKALGPNLFVVETADRTFFELRQLLRAITTGDDACPAEVARVLQELDGHAHR